MSDYSFISDLGNNFPFEQAGELFEENKHYWLTKDISFEDFAKGHSGWFFAGFYKNEFMGILYYHDFDDLEAPKICFMSGFAKRNCSIHIKNAIQILNDFLIKEYDLTTIYTKPNSRHARICDLRAGFKPFKDDILIWKGI